MTVSPLAASLATERTDRTLAPAASRTVEGTAQAEAFEKEMPVARAIAAVEGGTDDVHFRHQTSRSGELHPLQKFESFVLRSFIENMLPSQNTSFFGTGTAGNIWRSMLAERIGDEMAKSGGIGIAKMLEEEGRGGAQAPDTAQKTT
ncbi:flagellar biosynthesis protein FlgJ [Aureimonas flava]|uniref:Flagellar biosynthesis protein FlgJ n=1 Tax=Aureimonas flava TaxID=2320271 RepID=A0A3A1WMW6_9HYPH|nr:rod-binding protein [Aureimonas flava]RIY01877.1 flagellar biosynthesis protein FlgJ [Aureimonas flava]